MAATLRPETMAGQTNCWVLPEGQYGAYRGLDGEVYVMTARSARNLSFQDRTPATGAPELLLSLKGQDLIGVPLKVSSARLCWLRPCCVPGPPHPPLKGSARHGLRLAHERDWPSSPASILERADGA